MGLRPLPRPSNAWKAALGSLCLLVRNDELVEVDLELPAADSVVSTHEPVLEVADHPVRKGNNGLGTLPQPEPGRLQSWDMSVACRGQPFKALEAVGRQSNPS